MPGDTPARISKLHRRYLDEVPFISIQRARYFTESWRETERDGLPRGVRVALAMKNVYENMGMHIDPDDRIAGTWTEHFLGIPLDLEKGMFNRVMATELSRGAMARSMIRSNGRFVWYTVRKYGPRGALANARAISDFGIKLPTAGLLTLQSRPVNPYRIDQADRKFLTRRLLPYWEGRTIADKLEERLWSGGIYPGDMGELLRYMPDSNRLDMMIAIGASIGVWQGHLILDHEDQVRRGLAAMRDEVADRIENGAYSGGEELDFLSSVRLAIEGVITYARRLAERLAEELGRETDPDRAAVLERMLADCRVVPLGPPETFRQAVQSYWTVKTAVELAVPFNVHAPGRLDQYLYPYYKKDRDRGLITEAEAKELVEELFLKIMSHNMRPLSSNSQEFSQRYEGSEPVTLGGLTPEGEDATNELTYLMLDAAADSQAALNFVVRLHERSREELYLKLAEIYHRGISSVSMMNDEVTVGAMVKRGFAPRDARNNAITGCVDLVAPGKTGGESFSAILMCRVLDTTLRNGDSRTVMGLLSGVGVRTGDPDTFNSFEQFMDAYIEQAAFIIRKIVDATRMRDELYAEELPAPHISAFMGGCLESGKDVTRGGAVYDLEGILFMTSIANTVDSLYVIKKLVFEEKAATFKELLEAIDSNFAGHEELLKRIRSLDGKWGNGMPETDAIAAELTKRLFAETYKYTTYRGGWYAPFINSMTTHTLDGRMSLATPDGRLAGKPFAPSCGPYNVERNGVTGVLRSVAAIDFSDVMGCAVNIKLHPSAIGEGEEKRRKWVALVRTYFGMGGEQLQPTVASAEVLRAAKENPEAYRGVIVKVGGYSAYFTDLGTAIQDEIISRTEHG